MLDRDEYNMDLENGGLIFRIILQFNILIYICMQFVFLCKWKFSEMLSILVYFVLVCIVFIILILYLSFFR